MDSTLRRLALVTLTCLGLLVGCHRPGSPKAPGSPKPSDLQRRLDRVRGPERIDLTPGLHDLVPIYN